MKHKGFCLWAKVFFGGWDFGKKGGQIIMCIEKFRKKQLPQVQYILTNIYPLRNSRDDSAKNKEKRNSRDGLLKIKNSRVEYWPIMGLQN